MANVPPLLCISNTPPPIDFSEEDEDCSGLPSTLTLADDDDFGDFAIGSDSNEHFENEDVPSITDGLHSSPSAGFADFSPVYDHNHSYMTSSSPPPQLSESESSQAKVDKTININISVVATDVTKHETFNETNEEICSEPADLYNETEASEKTVVDSLRAVHGEDKTNCDIQPNSLDFHGLSLSEQNINSLSDSFESTDKDVSSAEMVSEADCGKRLNTKADFNENITITKEQAPNCIPPADPDLVIYNTVLLEDVTDESSDDELHSSKKQKHVIDESSPDFFGIQLLEQDNLAAEIASVYNCKTKISTVTPKEVDNISFEADFSKCFPDISKNNNGQETEPSTASNIEAGPTVELCTASAIDAVNDSTIEGPPTGATFVTDFATDPSTLGDIEDDFDDFQDFSAAPTSEDVVISTDTPVKQDSTASNAVDSDEDDFGDFSMGQFAAIPNINTQISPPVMHANNLDKRILPVLEMMFPSEASDITSPELQKEILNKLPLQSIDTAKALDYQWINSGVRHALLKAVGIDSRNILFGEKWNSSMPRFAANLSFNPLQPTKPQTASDGTHAVMQLTQNDQTEGASVWKSDIPAVQFDWSSSGLVNPLDGTKDDAHAREAEAIHLPPFEEPGAAAEKQQSYTTGVNSPGACTDATATEAGVAAATTTAEISPAFPAGLIGNSFHHSVQHADLKEATTGAKQLQESEEGKLAKDDDDDNSYSNNHSSNSSNIVPLQLYKAEDDEVVTTSTYAGPLKETHIYTPSKGEATAAKVNAKAATIDFDYEIAAAGIIIDETVVKKEYRDVEYNPGFDLEPSRALKAEFLSPTSPMRIPEIPTSDSLGTGEVLLTPSKEPQQQQISEFDDEFSEFQSVTAAADFLNNSLTQIATIREPQPAKEIVNNPPAMDEMILSPAILLPQAISMNSTNTVIEWGDAASSINAEELARIEELFPQPKQNKMKEQSATMPTGMPKNTLSISAAIAEKEKHTANDDDDWSEFVSVPVAANTQTNASNNNQLKQAAGSTTPQRQQHQRQYHQQQQQRQNHHHPHQQQHHHHQQTPLPPIFEYANKTNNSNDDEWCDFVSSVPASSHIGAQVRAPHQQFNSAAWQHANFYNNPLSLYHQKHTNVVSHNATSFKYQNNNNNNSNFNSSHFKHPPANLMQHQQQKQHHYQQQHQHHQPHPNQSPSQPQAQLPLQQIHMMQDFSTSTTSPTCRPNVVRNTPAASARAHQFQVGSARVTPSISLIPDLGFVAPAVPAHTTFIESLPKPTFSATKK